MKNMWRDSIAQYHEEICETLTIALSKWLLLNLNKIAKMAYQHDLYNQSSL